MYIGLRPFILHNRSFGKLTFITYPFVGFLTINIYVSVRVIMFVNLLGMDLRWVSSRRQTLQTLCTVIIYTREKSMAGGQISYSSYGSEPLENQKGRYFTPNLYTQLFTFDCKKVTYCNVFCVYSGVLHLFVH